MHRYIIFLFILFMQTAVFSQNEYFKLPNAKTQGPSYIFNKYIIGNEYLIKNLGTTEEEAKEKVKEIAVLKDKGNRKSNEYFNLTERGILFVDLKVGLESKTQSDLNEFFGLEKNTKIYIDGYLLESTKYRIASRGIIDIEIVEPDNINALKNRVLNIWTIAKNKRYREIKN